MRVFLVPSRMVYYLTVLPCACIGLSPMMIVPWRRSSTSEHLHHRRRKLGSGEGTVKKKARFHMRRRVSTRRLTTRPLDTPCARALDPVHTGPHAHGTSSCARAKASGLWIPRAHRLHLPRVHGASCVWLLGFAHVIPIMPLLTPSCLGPIYTPPPLRL